MSSLGVGCSDILPAPALCECEGVGGTSFERASIPAGYSLGVLAPGQGAAVHHVLIFPTSVSHRCPDTTADDLQPWRFNRKDFNLTWMRDTNCGLAKQHLE